jgi:hypothetical protein
MKQSNLEAALCCLRAASGYLNEDTETAEQVTWGVADAVSLIEDAKADIRGEIAARLPERPIFERRAS